MKSPGFTDFFFPFLFFKEGINMWNMRTKPVVLERLQYAKKIFGTAAG